MNQLLEQCSVMSDDKKERAVKIEDSLAEQVKFIVNQRNRGISSRDEKTTMSQYISDLIREQVQRDFYREVDRMKSDAEKMRKQNK